MCYPTQQLCLDSAPVKLTAGRDLQFCALAYEMAYIHTRAVKCTMQMLAVSAIDVCMANTNTLINAAACFLAWLLYLQQM